MICLKRVILFNISEVVHENLFGKKFYLDMESFTDEIEAQHRLAELQDGNPQIVLTIRES